MKLAWTFPLFAWLAVSCTETAVDKPAGPVAAPTSELAKPAETEKPAKPKVTEAASKPVEKPAVKPGEITGVEMGQLFTMLQSGKVYLIDVRPPLFYRLGHIDGAVNFPLRKYDAMLPKHHPLIKSALKEGKVVVLYCQNLNCPDAYKTATKLVKYGHSFSIYKGGWEEWKRSGLNN